MKDKKVASSSSPPPPPNLKNEKFVNWSKAESSKQEDNIVSSEWRQKLKTISPFLPKYGNKPVNMIYLLSGEYGRLWLKERDAWYKSVFVLKAKDRDMSERQKKIRKGIKEARKAAEACILERKARRQKETEEKKKAEAEKVEKLKLRVLKLKAAKQPPKTSKKSLPCSNPEPPNHHKASAQVEQPKLHKASAQVEPPKLHKASAQVEQPKQQKTPAQVEPETAQTCECSHHDKETCDDAQPRKERNETENKELEPGINQTQDSNKGCIMCDDYIKQLQQVHEDKCKVKELNTENKKAEQ